MARSLDQVLAEITAKSDPQRQLVLGQISSLPTQQAADESSLAAKKDQAFEDITAGARRKGLGFSGIPLGEQARYAATDYAPAVANLKASYGGRRATLESAFADIGRSDYTTAYDMFNQDRAFEEQQRQFNLQQEAARKAAAAQASVYAGLFNKPAPIQPVARPSLDSIFGSYDPNAIPLRVMPDSGSTIPLSVARPTANPRLGVAAPTANPMLRVR